MKTLAFALPGACLADTTAPLRNAKKFARSAALDFENRYLGYGTYFTDAAKQRLYTDELRAATRGLDAYATHRRYFRASPKTRRRSINCFTSISKTFLPCLNLITTDKTSMAANLEVRVPFLNRDLIEMAARMPPHLKAARLQTQVHTKARA